MIMLTSLEDIAVFRPVAAVLGDRFFFVASPAQVYDALPSGALKSEIGKFLQPGGLNTPIGTRTGRPRMGCGHVDCCRRR